MFAAMPYPPSDYNICPCCSTEFGNDDSGFTHRQLREMWIANGANWFFGAPPPHWNPWIQLINAQVNVPRLFTSFRFENTAVVEGAKIKLDSRLLELSPAA
jgi:hypothetical protein